MAGISIDCSTREVIIMDGRQSSGGYTVSVCYKSTRSTQLCIPPGSLNRVPASVGVKVGMSDLSGGR